ncbi:tRNA 5-methylaminomethyl-2-thiouridine biosynthesis bifunctional protein MnmC [Shimia sp. SK013]|uniref:NAD(P)/FAD-dependent oxidoreductase n=1 Tax=Shimia sp. SK013 TaxID=1389006 RepID=UPI0006B681B2|nr:FAD-dependent oxidoreductase [Shimia sp. SK013]KPA23609.1 tRNA 5-methylaminomethyl-2-thiouridine biosynthesis bifunctional protein MnmC [Shimia sp. SK013]
MTKSVAVLGAGIMGIATALQMARRGAKVCLFDQQSTLINGASRWNEGKIHLGYLYAGDQSGNSARAMLAAGLAFRPLIEDLIATSLAGHVTQHSDTYIVHPDSVVPPTAVAAHFAHVDDMISDQNTSGSLGAQHPTRRLSRSTLDQLSGGHGLDGFEVPEYSIDTQWLADRLTDAVEATQNIELILGARVDRATPTTSGMLGPWTVHTSDQISHGPFDVVVNALWEGRPVLDLALGLPVAEEGLHRFRKSLFVTTKHPCDVPSRVFVVGPFGDLKNYDGTRFYVSWYPAGLLAQGEGIAPPSVEHDRSDQDIIDQTRTQIERLAPDIAQVFQSASNIKVEGGWVYAQGRGRLDQASASIHRRDKYGIVQTGDYISVDTGKYSVAPFMAHRIATMITP